MIALRLDSTDPFRSWRRINVANLKEAHLTAQRRQHSRIFRCDGGQHAGHASNANVQT